MIPYDESQNLFSQFPPVSTAEWEEKIIADLKGADYEKKLIWNTAEGIKVKPYYRAEDLKSIGFLGANPGEYPFVRGNKAGGNDWEIRQDIDNPDILAANRVALEAISKGAQGIGFNMKRVVSPVHLHRLLEGIDPSNTAVHFISAYFYPSIVEPFVEELASRGIDPSMAKGSFNFDALGYYTLYGEYWGSARENCLEAAHLINLCNTRLPNFKVLNINGQHYHNGGANAVQELAFSLAQGNEYLAQLSEHGFDVDLLSKRMQFTFALGSNYFMEIAKLRAARMLWARIVEQYQPKDQASLKMFIHGKGSYWNKTVFDPYVNMLRSTVEGMAGAIGMCDSMHLRAFDKTFKYADSFSRRIAQNVQNLLKYESYFNRVADPAAGSYYIEHLTHEVASRAWDLFRKIESMGGFIQAAKQGFFVTEVTKSRKQLEEMIAKRQIPILGTSQYPNLTERMLDKINKEVFAPDLGGIPQSRASEPFEHLRFATESFAVSEEGFQPVVHLLTYGNLSMRKARANFAANFFGVAGFTVIEGQGHRTAEEAITAGWNPEVNILVFCSSDEEYGSLSPELCSALINNNPNLILVLAGYPADLAEQLAKQGIRNFIHIKTNILQSLKQFQAMLGIE
jgi:methylmalonyl-CoA mutase